jgi:acetylornithine deacetylase
MTVLTPRQILDQLVKFPTVSRDSNLELVDWLEGYLVSHGAKCFRHWNEDRQKAALIAHAGPWAEGAVVLSGHSDVVPVEGQTWTSDPWTVVERDGRLYGRGTCDMKGFVALAVWAVVEAAHRGVARPLQLALSYDEEVGCTGAPPMIAAMQGLVPKGEIALIGEPSRMKVITGHKGGTGYAVHVKGYEVHSSLLPEGVSAVMEAARLISWVNDHNETIQSQTPGPIGARFHPPFTTLHVGRIAVEMRCVPDDDIEAQAGAFRAAAMALDRALKAKRPEAGVHLDKFFDVSPLRPEVDGPAEALARALTGENASGVVSYGTEAGQFQDAGYSAVVIGPGDIAQAHQADEYLDVSEFQAGQRFMERLLERLG